MGSDSHESFVRWQCITREYFTAVSNLVLGLSTGLLAFLVTGLLASQPMSTMSRCISVISTISLILLAASVGIAVWCSINRLRDFRATAKIARARSNEEPVQPGARQETKIMGELSWRLFWWQLVLFAFGAAGASATVIARLWG